MFYLDLVINYASIVNTPLIATPRKIAMRRKKVNKQSVTATIKAALQIKPAPGERNAETEMVI